MIGEREKKERESRRPVVGERKRDGETEIEILGRVCWMLGTAGLYIYI